MPTTDSPAPKPLRGLRSKTRWGCPPLNLRSWWPWVRAHKVWGVADPTGSVVAQADKRPAAQMATRVVRRRGEWVGMVGAPGGLVGDCGGQFATANRRDNGSRVRGPQAGQVQHAQPDVIQ